MASDKEKKGFAGLDSMVSDVDLTPPPPLPSPVEQPRQSEQAETPEEDRRPVYTGQPGAGSGSGSGKWWLAGIGLVVFFVWVGSSDKPAQPGLASYSAPASPPAAAPYYPPAPEPSYSSNEESIPPVASGLTFDRAQIRYCLSEKIRIAAWQEQVNQYSDASVDAFNASVNDYNVRCSNFRYRSGALESVRSEVETNRTLLIRQGLASAARTP
jgi:hypothetical protein